MARDLALEALIRDALPRDPAFTEQSKFGGWVWRLDGQLVLGARHDGLLVRLGKDERSRALALPDVAPMISHGRPIEGWVRAGPAAWRDDALRAQLIVAAVRHARGLPPTT